MSASDKDQVDTLAKELKGLGETVDLPAHFGFVRTWYLVGPFDNTKNKGFDLPYPPEKMSSLMLLTKAKKAQSNGSISPLKIPMASSILTKCWVRRRKPPHMLSRVSTAPLRAPFMFGQAASHHSRFFMMVNKSLHAMSITMA